MGNKEKIQEARNRAIKKASAFKRLFGTPDGKKVLEELSIVFGEPKINVPGDAFATHVRVGQLEVLQYIHEVMEVTTDA